MKKLYICRGFPGAGKTTYARTLAPLVIETDLFRYNEDNEYVFDSDRNAEVIDKTKCLCEYAMRGLKMPCLAVTSVFTKIDHLLPYVRLAHRHGYAVTVVECKDQYENGHNVPDKVIERMKAEWEAFDEERANQEGVRFWRIERGEKAELYTPKGGTR